jgi:hypothetical protein
MFLDNALESKVTQSAVIGDVGLAAKKSRIPNNLGSMMSPSLINAVPCAVVETNARARTVQSTTTLMLNIPESRGRHKVAHALFFAERNESCRMHACGRRTTSCNLLHFLRLLPYTYLLRRAV